ncbi:hypothetical protein PIB30_080759 [Stylosanthes scabra]|uniref:Uncharacterized protein n=1 Tax=Stylosanthes scabra TaxID=79078 RepID=A0ABU6QS73_9FABA|nr:hypothetical protein [Stylosanthes scabra]
MAKLGHTFEDVHPSMYDLEFNVCVIRIWEVPAKFNPNEIQSLEMVVQDHKDPCWYCLGLGKEMEASRTSVSEVLDDEVVLNSDTFGITTVQNLSLSFSNTSRFQGGMARHHFREALIYQKCTSTLRWRNRGSDYIKGNVGGEWASIVWCN